MIWLRSALFNLIYALSAVVYSVPSVLSLLLPFPQRYRVVSQWARFNLWTLKHLCGLDFRVEGLEHLPDQAAVAFVKHQSAWETLALQRILPLQCWVLKRELLWIPFFGWGLAVLRPIAIDRKAGKKALQQVIEEGTERLQSGIWVVIFPEGTRVPPGRKGEYKPGAAQLAGKAERPLVPIAHNAGEFWPKRGFLKRPGTITVVVGPPIPTTGRRPSQVHREAVAWMEATMDRITDPRFKETHKEKAP